MTLVRVVPLSRPVKPAIDWHREYSQAERDALARYADEQNRLRTEFLQQWSPSVPIPDDPEADGYFEASNAEGVAFDCWKLRREGYVVAATKPVWVNHVEDYWLTKFGDGVFDRQPTAASITLPFLMQEGEFAVTYESYKQHDDDGKIETRLVNKKRLRVSSEHGIHVGHLDSYNGEMSATLVILPSGTPQDVADRVALAYSRISTLNLPEDYPVVMPLREHCTVCGRPFTDLVSRVIGIGPTCAARLGVPYSASYANRIVAARQAFLSGAGTETTKACSDVALDEPHQPSNADVSPRNVISTSFYRGYQIEEIDGAFTVSKGGVVCSLPNEDEAMAWINARINETPLRD